MTIEKFTLGRFRTYSPYFKIGWKKRKESKNNKEILTLYFSLYCNIDFTI
tara:strand:- start:1386 stop:1535 length:150 start_codon:yes stop_codon:yes gene_type:complete